MRSFLIFAQCPVPKFPFWWQVFRNKHLRLGPRIITFKSWLDHLPISLKLSQKLKLNISWQCAFQVRLGPCLLLECHVTCCTAVHCAQNCTSAPSEFWPGTQCSGWVVHTVFLSSALPPKSHLLFTKLYITGLGSIDLVGSYNGCNAHSISEQCICLYTTQAGWLPTADTSCGADWGIASQVSGEGGGGVKVS